MFENRGKSVPPAGRYQPMEGQSVYDARNAKVGTISAVVGQGDYFVVTKGLLIPHDVYLPRSAVARSDSNGVFLNVSKDELRESRYLTPPAMGTTAAAGTTAALGTTAVERTSSATSLSAQAPTPAQAPTLTPPTSEVPALGEASTRARRDAAWERPVTTTNAEAEDIRVPIHEEALLANKVREQIVTVHVHR